MRLRVAKSMKYISKLLILGALILGACAGGEAVKVSAPVSKDYQLTQSNFSELPGWGGDNFDDFTRAYAKSCDAILKRGSQNNFYKNDVANKFGKNQQWQIACRKIKNAGNDALTLKSFFEQNFIPYSVSAGGKTEGLFTGYYEAALNGSRVRSGVYQYPLYARPDDLVMVQLGEFRDELKGQRIAGRVVDGKLKVYETHAEINAGQLPNAQPLVWVDSAVDAFFLQIQGSGIVSLDDGGVMRVGYSGQNGHPYYAIGRELVKRGAMSKADVSMQSIRGWLEANPSQAQEIMETNKSFVFFRELSGDGPVGGQGVSLTAERSLAIDRSIIPYGMPVWVDLAHPANDARLQRMMVTQDTGGAIRGPIRGDYFWGYGARAEEMAGAMKSKGRYWFLLPK